MRQETSGVDMQSTPLINVPDAVDPQDAMNKRSVQGLIVGSTSFTHNQINPASVWTVNHNLNKLYPNIVIVDSANDLIIGYDLDPVDVNNTILTFSASFSGIATFS